MKLSKLQTIYFIGIGGIGMSALARYFNENNKKVSGYDKTETILTKKLVKEGIEIHYDEHIKNIPQNVDLIIYTPAIPKDHLELQFVMKKGKPLMKRAEVLGMISREKKMVGVAGTHGKTTTSTLLTYLLRKGGVDCTAFMGGIANNFKSNYIGGKSDWVVVEADEYDRSFLHLNPDIAVLTSLDADHLDIYGSHEEMLKTGFAKFLKGVKKGGSIFFKNSLEKNFPSITSKNSGFECETYGVNRGIGKATKIRVENGYFVFDYTNAHHKINDIRFTLPGRHNIENATAAIGVALQLGVKPEAIKKALGSFKGIQRRFEMVYRNEEVAYVDDYAHHPTELKAAIGAAKELFPNKKITGIFQPHLYSRTKDFVKGFAKELSKLDEVILLDIYPARELPIKGVTSDIIFDKIKEKEKYRASKKDLMAMLTERAQKKEFEVILTLGAGDINTFVKPIKKLLRKKYGTD